MLAYFAQSAPAILRLVTYPPFDPGTVARAHERILASALVDGLAARLRDLQERGALGPVDVHAAAETFVAALHSVAMFHVFSGAGPELGRSGSGERLVGVLWRGLAPRRSS